jgi:hypothetical protein
MSTRKRPQRVRSGADPQLDGLETHWDSLFQSLGRIEIVLLIGAILLLLVLIY